MLQILLAGVSYSGFWDHFSAQWEPSSGHNDAPYTLVDDVDAATKPELDLAAAQTLSARERESAMAKLERWQKNSLAFTMTHPRPYLDELDHVGRGVVDAPRERRNNGGDARSFSFRTRSSARPTAHDAHETWRTALSLLGEEESPSPLMLANEVGGVAAEAASSRERRDGGGGGAHSLRTRSRTRTAAPDALRDIAGKIAVQRHTRPMLLHTLYARHSSALPENANRAATTTTSGSDAAAPEQPLRLLPDEAVMQYRQALVLDLLDAFAKTREGVQERVHSASNVA